MPKVGEIYRSFTGVIEILSPNTFIWLESRNHDNRDVIYHTNIVNEDLVRYGWRLDEATMVDLILEKYGH